MVNRNIALIACVAAVAAVLTATSSQGMAMTRTNNLTFSHAVALPGVTLPAGTYIFETAPLGTHPDIVRVTTVNGQKQLYLGFTNPTERPRGSRDRVLSFGEAPAGEPKPIVAWYPIGSSLGHAFLYR